MKLHWKKVIIEVVVACLVLCVMSRSQTGAIENANGQNTQLDGQSTKLNGQSTEVSGQSTQVNGPNSQLTADQIIDVLRTNPALLDQVRKEAIKRGQEQGRLVDESALTDDRIFELVREDATIRSMIAEVISSKPTATESGPTIAPRAGAKPSARSGAAAANVEDRNQAPTAQQQVPYPQLQSLQDLYKQLPQAGGVLPRFGADIFRNGTGNLEDLPMDLPAGPEYVLGPGDGLNIDMSGSVSQHLTRTVDRQGKVALPEAGAVTVAGRTLGDAQQMIENALRTQYHTVKVDVSLTRLRSVRVYVVGDVQRPGAYDISSLSTPLNALYVAGGPTTRGSLRTVKHYRGQQLVRDVDLYELLLHGVRTDAERLEPGDTILVPPVGPQVTVAGMVHRPAVYELRSEADLGEVIELAGGVLVSANLGQISVERIQAHERRVMVSVKVPDGTDGSTVTKLLGGFHVQDGDRVTIAPILPYSEQTVYLEGHVFRPGKFQFSRGMTVSDLVKSYQDLLPEPAQHAEIVRLVPPDYRPVTIEFKLGDVLEGDDPIELQPFDTVRIFGRYEIDPPKVFIYGEVLRPGEYPLADNMTAAALVRMAGGFKRSAFTRQADISSYVVQNGQKILTEHAVVDMADALAGNSAADVKLKPGDVLTIRQLTGWNDIGASVTLNGEVTYPGTYGIREGEKLSSLLRRAGGLRNTSYAEGAVLERVQVRELAQKSQDELVTRIQSQSASISFSSGTNAADQQALMQAMRTQQQDVLAALRGHPQTGRLVIKITNDIGRWQNTAADIELRSGDVLTIPKRPNFVIITGQVYNPSAITYTPGRTADWYLRQAGGFTELANKHGVFVVHADGSVLGMDGSGLLHGSALSSRLQPGDSIVVPEKVIGGSAVWRNLLNTAQIVSGLALTARVATSF